jgi:glycosyltransferase involved in cell wall biosynthesis
MAAGEPSFSVIIPAFNEEDYLPTTLDCLRAAEQRLRDTIAGANVEVIVVDNASTDGTAACARRGGATIVREPDHNVAKVRNAGARAATHEILVFLDADTLVPSEWLLAIANAMTNPQCVGGAVDTDYKPKRVAMAAYISLWRMLGRIGDMAQGACQFCRRDVFDDLGGYAETHYMGEDVDFYWRLARLAARRGLTTTMIRSVRVVPSARRYDGWAVWRTLIWTNPLIILALRRHRDAWPGWYRTPPR